MLKGKELMFLLRKPRVAELAETMMAMRLVPLAVAGGNPKKISNGRVSNEPPPAMVLTKPANKPAPTNMRISNGKSSI
jgi:hypothetical protein